MLLLTIFACSTTHGVRPLGKGVVAPEFSVGGPLTEIYGLPMPLPLSTLGATVGVTDRVDVHAAWHPTAALITGVVAGEVGADVELFPPDGARPRIMADVTVVAAGGDTAEGGADGGFRVFVQPTVLASWDWGKLRRQSFYAGLTAFTQPYPMRAVGAVLAGNQWGIGPRVFATTELKWIGPYADTEPFVPNYFAPGDLGAVSVQLGAGVRLGKLP